MKIRLEGTHFIYLEYPFEHIGPGVLNPIAATDIQEYLPNRKPMELVTKTQEVLFIREEDTPAWIAWGNSMGIPSSNRLDLWALLNEPFLDTVFSQEKQDQSFARLAENGLDRKEVLGIRQKVQSQMLMYNTVLWEWVHLGHYDVLLSRKKYSLQRLSQSFYQWSMGIGLRNRV